MLPYNRASACAFMQLNSKKIDLLDHHSSSLIGNIKKSSLKTQNLENYLYRNSEKTNYAKSKFSILKIIFLNSTKKINFDYLKRI